MRCPVMTFEIICPHPKRAKYEKGPCFGGGGQNCQLGGPVRGFEGTCPTQCILKEALGYSNIFFISLWIRTLACAPVFTQKCVVCATSSEKGVP